MLRGMPINTDIAIDFSYQTITNALRNYAVAMMVHNYEHQRSAHRSNLFPVLFVNHHHRDLTSEP